MDTIRFVKKRDGRTVEYNKDKITNAIFAAAKSIGGHDKKESELLAEKVEAILEFQFGSENIPTVENIQDIVEKVLIKSGHAKTAKAYILYRSHHEKLRQTKRAFLEVKESMNEYLEKSDWRVYENSNADYSFSGLMSHVAGKIISNYTLN